MKNARISLLLKRRLFTQQTRYKMRSYLIKDKDIDKLLSIALHLKHLRHKLETSGELTSVAANFHMAGSLSSPMCDDTNSTRAKRQRLYLNGKWLKWAEFFSHKLFRSHVIFWQVFVCVALLSRSMQAFENRGYDIIFFFHHYKHTRIRIRTRRRHEYGILSLVIVERGSYAHVIPIDNYIELNNGVTKKSNGDWFIDESYRFYCFHLLAGAIIIDRNKGSAVNTFEVYGRTPSTDAHCERFLYGKNAASTSLPTPSTSSKYNAVAILMKTEDNSTKLIISTKSMNALVTSSLRIDMEVDPDIGSFTMEFTPSINTKIFIEIKGASSGQSIPYKSAIERAITTNTITNEEKINNHRLVKVLKLEPVLLEDQDGEEYPLLGNKEVVEEVNQKRSLHLSVLKVDPKKKRTSTNSVPENNTDLDTIIKRGPYIKTINPECYIELNDEMADKLNKDWYINENYKLYCCHLLTGAILIDGSKGIIINTVELYGRIPSIDAHYERFLNGKNAVATTLPTPSTSTKYNDIIVVIRTEDNSRKLIISTKSVNALVTSSLGIDMEVDPDVGSSTMEFTPSINTKIIIEIKGVSIEQVIPYKSAIQRAISANTVTNEEKINNNRLVKVLKLEPVLLEDQDGVEYPLLGNKEVVQDIEMKKNLHLSVLKIDPKKKRASINSIAEDTTDLHTIIKRGPYFEIINAECYIELNDEMASKLNGDWYIEPKYKLYCCHLLAGAILIDGSKGIIINTVELYGRTPSADAHYERFLYGKNAAPTTLPTPSTSTKYDDVVVVKKTEDSSTKLIISTKCMNALVTSSLRVDMEVEPDIGSSTVEFTPSLNTRIFIENNQIHAAQEALDDDEVKYLYNHNMLSQLRQVRSKYNDASTYETLRGSSPITNNHCTKPYTIWTLFDFDDNTALSSGPKMGSRLFQVIARNHLSNKLVSVVLFLSSIK